MSENHKGCEADIDRLTSEAATLKAQLADTEQKVKDYSSITSVNRRCAQAESALAQATAERDAARGEVVAQKRLLAERREYRERRLEEIASLQSELTAARAEIVLVRDQALAHNNRAAALAADLSTARAEVEQAHKVLDTYGIVRGALAHSVACRIGLIDVPAYEARFDAVSAELSSARAAAELVLSNHKDYYAFAEASAAHKAKVIHELSERAEKAEMEVVRLNDRRTDALNALEAALRELQPRG